MFPEVFVLPYHERFILSFPLSGHVFLVNAALVNVLRQAIPENSAMMSLTCPDLKELNEVESAKGQDQSFSPTSVVIFVTNGCNLNCKYCFAMPKYRKPQFISENFAKAGLELAASNAAQKDMTFSVHLRELQEIKYPRLLPRYRGY